MNRTALFVCLCVRCMGQGTLRQGGTGAKPNNVVRAYSPVYWCCFLILCRIHVIFYVILEDFYNHFISKQF